MQRKIQPFTVRFLTPASVVFITLPRQFSNIKPSIFTYETLSKRTTVPPNWLKEIFAASVWVQAGLALLLTLLVNSIGIWFLLCRMSIPDGRMTAAVWVLEFSLITLIINLFAVPYNATIIAHEKMGVFAFLGILETMMKLALVLMLTVISTDKLITWACFSFATALTIRVTYQVYCRQHFEECRLKFSNDVSLFKEMFSFAGWNMFGSVAWMLRDQGLNILLNMFWGPVVNAARGAALQVSNAVSGFVGNFNTAINP